MDGPGSRWRTLPLAIRVTVVAVVAAVVVWVLFTVVFPRVERYLDDPTLGGLPGQLERMVA